MLELEELVERVPSRERKHEEQAEKNVYLKVNVN